MPMSYLRTTQGPMLSRLVRYRVSMQCYRESMSIILRLVMIALRFGFRVLLQRPKARA